MGKVYIIVHDGTNVPVGQGGRSGKRKYLRRGYHLPGGTAESADLDQEAVRELREETGITLPSTSVTKQFTVDSIPDVTFAVAKVKSLPTNEFRRPRVTNEYDEPFTSVKAVPKSSWDDGNFSSAYWTDWFGAGLKHAVENNLLT